MYTKHLKSVLLSQMNGDAELTRRLVSRLSRQEKALIVEIISNLAKAYYTGVGYVSFMKVYYYLKNCCSLPLQCLQLPHVFVFYYKNVAIIALEKRSSHMRTGFNYPTNPMGFNCYYVINQFLLLNRRRLLRYFFKAVCHENWSLAAAYSFLEQYNIEYVVADDLTFISVPICRGRAVTVVFGQNNYISRRFNLVNRV